MTRKEAIKGSLDKWNAICADLMDMSEARQICDLCEKYGRDCEGTCPMHEVGNGCIRGAWGKICSILRKEHIFDYRAIGTLSEQECWTPLSVYCAEMRETLQKLYDEEVKKAKDATPQRLYFGCYIDHQDGE